MPVLPDGWQYEVVATGPGGSVRISPYPGDRAGYDVQVNPSGGGQRRIDVTALPEALKCAADAVKALDRLAKADREYHEARAQILGALGEDDGEPDDDADAPGAVADPVEAGDLAKDGGDE